MLKFLHSKKMSAVTVQSEMDRRTVVRTSRVVTLSVRNEYARTDGLCRVTVNVTSTQHSSFCHGRICVCICMYIRVNVCARACVNLSHMHACKLDATHMCMNVACRQQGSASVISHAINGSESGYLSMCMYVNACVCIHVPWSCAEHIPHT